MSWWAAIPAVIQGVSTIANMNKKQPAPMISNRRQIMTPTQSGNKTEAMLSIAGNAMSAASSMGGGASSGAGAQTASAAPAQAGFSLMQGIGEQPKSPLMQGIGEDTAMSRRMETMRGGDMQQLEQARAQLKYAPYSVKTEYEPMITEAIKRRRNQNGGGY